MTKVPATLQMKHRGYMPMGQIESSKLEARRWDKSVNGQDRESISLLSFFFYLLCSYLSPFFFLGECTDT
jgi:hypothetical protein